MKRSFSYFAASYVDLEDYCDHMSVCQFQKGSCWDISFPLTVHLSSEHGKGLWTATTLFHSRWVSFSLEAFLALVALIFAIGSIIGENKLGFIVVVPSFCIALLFPGDSVSLPLAFFQWLLSHIGGSW